MATFTFDLTKFLSDMDENFLRNQEYVYKAHERNKGRVENTVLFLQEATGSGLRLGPVCDMASPRWEINLDNKDDWRILHQIVGELEQYSVEPATNDLRKRLVKVILNPKDERFKHLRFSYIRKLEKTDKCKLTREKSSYVNMHCES